MRDRQHAQRLLQQHKQGYYSIRVAMMPMARRYVLSGITLAGIIAALFLLNDARVLLWILAGVFAGAFLRDWAWLRGIKRTWPFTEKIIDWKKVETIAEGGAEPDAVIPSRPSATPETRKDAPGRPR